MGPGDKERRDHKGVCGEGEIRALEMNEYCLPSFQSVLGHWQRGKIVN